jgi:NAD(P)-dependent dehydrogenase (short-subunit alcohol dehydrogenase family)
MADLGRGAIVVTGASTGIGRAATLHLAGLGFHIYAGVRNESDGLALQQECPERIDWMLLDVTDDSQIQAAAQLVADKTGECGLAGLLNNAGISVNGPLEFLPIDDLRRQLEVNVIGQIAVTQAFLPLIRMTRGRIVNMGSIAGRMSMVMGGPYSASKFAMEAITDALRMELRSFGIEVIIIEPGAIETPIWEKTLGTATERLAELPAAMTEYYGPMIETAIKTARSTAQSALPVEKVTRVIEHAFTASKPRTRYVVGRDAKIQSFMAYLPDRWRDRFILNYLDRRANSH